MPINTPHSSPRCLLRHQRNFVVSSFSQRPASLCSPSRVCSIANLADPHVSPCRSTHDVFTPNQFNMNDNTINPYALEELTYQTPNFASAHRSLQHGYGTNHPVGSTNLPRISSPSPSLDRSEAQNTPEPSRALAFSTGKQGHPVTAYASLKDSEEWSTFPPRKKRKKTPPGVTTTGKFTLPMMIPSNKATITPMKRTVTLYKPPRAEASGSGYRSPVILKLRRAGAREAERSRHVRSTGSAGNTSRGMNMLDQAEGTLEPSLGSSNRTSESSPLTSPPSSPSPNVSFLLPGIQRTYPATRKAISEVKNWNFILHHFLRCPSSARVLLSRDLRCSTLKAVVSLTRMSV